MSMIPKRLMSEEDIKLQFITPSVTAKWDISKITMETKLTDGKINLKGNFVVREKPKRADYVLYLATNHPIAIIEAKDNNHSVSHGLQQAMAYAQMLDLPFAFSSNGDGFAEHDFLTGMERQFGLDEFPTVGADREQLCRDFHIFLPFRHLPNDIFVIKGFPTARLTALKQTVIALRVEKSFFVKACLLKTMVNICCNHKIVLVSHQLQKVIVDRFGGIHIAVDVDVSAPICPMLLGRFVRVKSARIHILKSVFFAKIGKVFFKPLTAVSKACGGGKPCTCADYNSVSRADFFF